MLLRELKAGAADVVCLCGFLVRGLKRVISWSIRVLCVREPAGLLYLSPAITYS